MTYVIADGMLIPIDRVTADRSPYFGKRRMHGMILQVDHPAGRDGPVPLPLTRRSIGQRHPRATELRTHRRTNSSVFHRPPCDGDRPRETVTVRAMSTAPSVWPFGKLSRPIWSQHH